MGMRSVFQKAAMTAFKITGDIPQPATYIETEDNGFDDPVSTENICQIIYDEFTAKELDYYGWTPNFKKKDIKGLIPSLSISVPIGNKGQIRREDGQVYEIKEKFIDAADAMYVLLLRKV